MSRVAPTSNCLHVPQNKYLFKFVSSLSKSILLTLCVCAVCNAVALHRPASNRLSIALHFSNSQCIIFLQLSFVATSERSPPPFDSFTSLRARRIRLPIEFPHCQHSIRYVLSATNSTFPSRSLTHERSRNTPPLSSPPPPAPFVAVTQCCGMRLS